MSNSSIYSFLIIENNKRSICTSFFLHEIGISWKKIFSSQKKTGKQSKSFQLLHNNSFGFSISVGRKGNRKI